MIQPFPTVSALDAKHSCGFQSSLLYLVPHKTGSAPSWSYMHGSWMVDCRGRVVSVG